MKKTKYKILLGMLVFGTAYAAWKIFQPVEIVAVHTQKFGESAFGNYIIVRHFPLTDQGKITWWEDNRAMLKRKYDIPKYDLNSGFSVSIWDFGDGYKKLPTGDLRLSLESSDLLCFDEMKTEKNCIDKNWIMGIEKIRDNRIFFSIGRSSYQQATEGGKVTKNND